MEQQSLSPFGRVEWIHLDEVDSTNTFLSAYVRADASCRCVVADADYQTGGRGQRGNRWESQRGANLLFTVALYDVPVAPTEQFLLSQLVSLVTLRVLRSVLPADADRFRIKWPNDIYFDDRKVGGILIEHQLSPSHILRTIVGVGLNVNQRQFVSDAPNPVSLCQIAHHDFARRPLLEQWVALLTEGMAAFDDSSRAAEKNSRAEKKNSREKKLNSRAVAGKSRAISDDSRAVSDGSREAFISVLVDDYHQALFRRDVPARYRDADGLFTATLRRVEPDGRLCLERPDGTVSRYAFKEVSFII